jgi:diguanylate cyclase (GGDEF)-like protein
MTNDSHAMIRQQIAYYTQRIHELEHALIQANSLLHEDCLTGVLNRRGFGQACQTLATDANACSAVCCVALDLDHFKQINDTHGHAVGDAALVHFAQALRLNVRPIDTVARLGGDEFILILMEMTAPDTCALLYRFMTALADSPLMTDRGPIPLRASAGVAQLSGDESISRAMMRADLALLAAKRLGRGHIVVASQTSDVPELIPKNWG